MELVFVMGKIHAKTRPVRRQRNQLFSMLDSEKKHSSKRGHNFAKNNSKIICSLK
jgi:hypothetical protein